MKSAKLKNMLKQKTGSQMRIQLLDQMMFFFDKK